MPEFDARKETVREEFRASYGLMRAEMAALRKLMNGFRGAEQNVSRATNEISELFSHFFLVDENNDVANGQSVHTRVQTALKQLRRLLKLTPQSRDREFSRTLKKRARAFRSAKLEFDRVRKQLIAQCHSTVEVVGAVEAFLDEHLTTPIEIKRVERLGSIGKVIRVNERVMGAQELIRQTQQMLAKSDRYLPLHLSIPILN